MEVKMWLLQSWAICQGIDINPGKGHLWLCIDNVWRLWCTGMPWTVLSVWLLSSQTIQNSLKNLVYQCMLVTLLKQYKIHGKGRCAGNSWIYPRVVVVIPVKPEVWHIKFCSTPSFLNIMDIWHDISLAFYCNCVICVVMDIIILTQVPDYLL